MGEIFVVVEHRAGEVREITYQMLWKADELSRKLTHTLTAVIMGGKDEAFVGDIAERADRVIVVEDDKLKDFNGDFYKEILHGLIKESHPFLTLIGQTPWGMDFAPPLSVKSGLPLATDCVDVLMEDGHPKVIRQIYSGKIFSKVSFKASEGYLITVRPGAFPTDKVGERKGELSNMLPDGNGRVRLDYIIPSRGLIGFQTEFLTLTSGTGLIYHVFHHYGPAQSGGIAPRHNGALISNSTGKALGYALFNLQERGKLMISPGMEIYEGQVVGIHSRDNDLTVNPLKAKQLTNIRAAGSDENIILTPPIRFSLEQALEFIADDELVEITPAEIRIRKKHLKEHERKSAMRKSA